MEVSQVSKMLAYSFVSELINKKKVKKNGHMGDEPDDVDISEMSFGDLETYYTNVLAVIEDSPEIRESLVESIKKAQEQGEDLNLRYSSKLIAEEKSLQRQLFM